MPHVNSPVTSLTFSTEFSNVRNVPVFCGRHIADLPDVVDVMNIEGNSTDPLLTFRIEKYDEIEDESAEKMKLGVVIALRTMPRVDIADKELLVNLREKKGFANVVMVILRRGSDTSKFKPTIDDSINSGVGKEKGLIQLVHAEGKILDMPANKANISRFFEMVKLAF